MNERRWFGSFSTVERCDGDATGDEEERGREGGEKKNLFVDLSKVFRQGEGGERKRKSCYPFIEEKIRVNRRILDARFHPMRLNNYNDNEREL